jgi:hypothetical protein
MYMCTVLLAPGGYPIAVKYIISHHITPELVRDVLIGVMHEYIQRRLYQSLYHQDALGLNPFTAR